MTNYNSNYGYFDDYGSGFYSNNNIFQTDYGFIQPDYTEYNNNNSNNKQQAYE